MSSSYDSHVFIKYHFSFLLFEIKIWRLPISGVYLETVRHFLSCAVLTMSHWGRVYVSIWRLLKESHYHTLPRQFLDSIQLLTFLPWRGSGFAKSCSYEGFKRVSAPAVLWRSSTLHIQDLDVWVSNSFSRQLTVHLSFLLFKTSLLLLFSFSSFLFFCFLSTISSFFILFHLLTSVTIRL